MLHTDDFYSFLGAEDYDFSKETVDHFLQKLEASGQLLRVFGNYYYSLYEERNGKFYWNSQSLFCGWDAIDESLGNFISEHSPVSREQLRENFPNYCQKSIDAYLESGVKTKMLALENGEYWDADEYPGWRVPSGFHLNFEEPATV